MSTACSACASPIPPGASQCPTCGALVGHLVPERKLVTVVFADVVGSTRLGEELDVEPLRDLLDIFSAAMREEVEALGGLCQFLGDGVMAVFGLPATQETDVDRALTAAVNMLGRLEGINQRVEPVYRTHVDMRIGVNTGETLLPAGGEIQLGRLTGDVLNVGARLQAAARPGSVLVADRTVRTSRLFRFDDRGLLEVKGRARPVHAFELVELRGTPRRSTPLLRAPMVGRSDTMEELAGMWQQVVRTGEPRLVTLIGDAGVGKSRFVAEFLDEVPGSAAAVLEGRCLPFGEEQALRPLADMWRRQIGAFESDPPEVMRAKTAKYAGELLDDSDLASALIGLHYTLDLEPEQPTELGPSAIVAIIRNAWRQVLTALAAGRPVIVVIEDLHWADPSLIDLLDGLACCIDAPVMIMCSTRPSLFDEMPNAPIGDTVRLLPLSLTASADLFEGLLDGSTGLEMLKAAALPRADGNPLFLEEILRHLVDTGRLVADEGQWRISGEIDPTHMPDSIQGVIAGRIDLLEPDEKYVLQCAAVVGQVFWRGSVASLTGYPAATVAGLLSSLEERDLIRPRPSVFALDREFVFKHVLMQEVAYGTLPRRLRATLHDGVVEWLESGPQTWQPDLVAHHAVRSFEEGERVLTFSADERARRRGRAFDALLAASEAFRTRNSIESAIEQARRAEELVTGDGERARVEEALGEAAYFRYEGDAAWFHLRRAIDLMISSGTGTEPELARLAGRALETPLRRPGIMEHYPSEQVVFDYLTRALGWAGPGDSAERARLLMLMSFWRHAYPATDEDPALVSDEEALSAGEQAAAMAQRVDRPDLESAALDGVSANHIPDSNYAEAWRATHRRLALVADIHDPEEVGDIYAMQCWIDYHRGHYREVRDFAETGFQRTIDQVPSVALHCVAWRGMGKFRLGDWDGVLADLSVGEEILGQGRPSPPYFASGLWAVSAVVHGMRGERGRADDLMETLAASQSTEPGSDSVPLATWIEFLGPLLARRGQTDLALHLNAATMFRRGTRRGLLFHAECDTLLEAMRFERAGAVARATREFGQARGLESLIPAADRLEGAALMETGRTIEAIRRLRRAQLGFRSLDALYDAAVTERLLAKALVDADSPDATLSHRASDTLRSLGIVDSPSMEPA